MKTFKILLSTVVLSCSVLLSYTQTEEKTTDTDQVTTSCYELNDIDNSGNIYTATVTVDKNNNVEGEIIVKNNDNHNFTVTFKGVLMGENLKVTSKYSNDVAGLPYDEDWKLSKKHFTGSHQPQVIMHATECK